MQMHMVLACPILTPPSQRNPGSAKSAEFSVGGCHQQCSKSRWPWQSALFQCEGSYRYFKVGVETKERPRINPFCLKMRQWWPPQHKGGVRKSAFPML